MSPPLPRLAVWKFASCDGCQLSLLDAEDHLLAAAQAVEIAYFPEATRKPLRGDFDISLVEGSITTRSDAKRIRQVRKRSRLLVTLGACATAGGIQALRNSKDVNEFIRCVYPEPSYIDTLASSTPISEHVKVDIELRGCPVDKLQLLEVLRAALQGARPSVRSHSVCIDCKRRGTPCVLVAQGLPCLGPVTHAGCGAICPAYGRACYGCFGPSEDPNTASAVSLYRGLGRTPEQVRELFRGFTAWAEPFRKVHEEGR